MYSSSTTTVQPPITNGIMRKFTLSCSRCRASKLKCDRKEPCIECMKRNIGHLCTKDERQPRKLQRKEKDAPPQATNANAAADSQHRETEAEESAQVLEHFVDGAFPNHHRPNASKTRPPSVAPDLPNRYWLNSDSRRRGEKLALIREVVDSLPELETMRVLHDVFTTRCQGALGNVAHTESFLEETERLRNCLQLGSAELRVMAVSCTASMDMLATYLMALVLGLAFHPTPSILGWNPAPASLRVEELRASDAHRKTWRSLALRCLYGGASIFCGSIASLQASIMLLLDGEEEELILDSILVAAISGAQKLGLHRLGDIKLHASASPTTPIDSDSPSSGMLPHIRTEIGIRIWWALVMRDWARGQTLGYYTIHPAHFNTRMPLHINDDDLCLSTWRANTGGHILERPRSEFTKLSYTVHAIELAVMVRESIDLRGPLVNPQAPEAITATAKTQLNRKYEKFVAGLPCYFRLGSTVGLTATGPMMAAIPVHRWMLHQQLWSFFLRLHRGNLSSPVGRAACRPLAQNVVSLQAQMQARCSVCCSLSTSNTQLFNAAVVLVLDLLFSSEHHDPEDSNAQLSRLMARDKIRESIELLRPAGIADNSARRSVSALEALLKLDEQLSGDDEEVNGVSAPRNGLRRERRSSVNSASLRARIMETLKVINQTTKNTTTAPEPEIDLDYHSLPTTSIGFPSHNYEFSPVDVLPILNNGPSPNFWQFLDFNSLPSDFDAQNVPATTSGDLHGLFSPPSGATQSLSSMSTPGFTDTYSSTDGTRLTEPSPSYINEVDPLKLGGEGEPTIDPSSTDVYDAAAQFYYSMDHGTHPSL